MKTKAIRFAMFIGATLALIGPASAQEPKTVVLVHGAFADGTSWEKIIPLLEAKGLKVVAVQNPLTSLADDVAAAKRAIADQTGPVILVGHSWGGMVITEAGNDDKVAALVYVAAFAPDDGQSAGDLGKEYPTTPGVQTLVKDKAGFLSLPAESVAKFFAPDLPASETRVMAVTQGPIAASCFGDKISTAAWKKKPSWFVVAKNDHMISPDYEQAVAKTMKATTTTLPSSHVAMLSHPREVAAVIVAAASAVK